MVFCAPRTRFFRLTQTHSHTGTHSSFVRSFRRSPHTKPVPAALAERVGKHDEHDANAAHDTCDSEHSKHKTEATAVARLAAYRARARARAAAATQHSTHNTTATATRRATRHAALPSFGGAKVCTHHTRDKLLALCAVPTERPECVRACQREAGG